MFSISSYMMIVASILSTICVGSPINSSEPEKTQLLNVYTKPVQKYYKPVYIDMSNGANDNAVKVQLPTQKLSNYQK